MRNWSRVVLYSEAKRLLALLQPTTLDAFDVSGGGLFWPGFNFRSYTSSQYPEYDVCSGPLPRQVDLVILDNVLEHVRYPNRALKNVFASLRSPGHVFVAAPFMVKQHLHPVDLHRWTEYGMRCLLEDSGFTNIQSGSWGNSAYVAANLVRWEPYDEKRHSLANERDCPVQVWALARRG